MLHHLLWLEESVARYLVQLDTRQQPTFFARTSLSVGRRGERLLRGSGLSTAVQKWVLCIRFEQVTEVGVVTCRGGTRAPHGDDDHLSVLTVLPDLPRQLHTI